jgi:hypothetical protein
MLRWWLRVVGALYLVMFAAAAVLRLPVRVMSPADTLHRAAAGDPTARLLVDTWLTLGLEFFVVGAALLVASRTPDRARALVWTVLGLEAVRGIGTATYMIARGYEALPHVVWIVIHATVIITGLASLRRSRTVIEASEEQSDDEEWIAG